LSAEKAREGSEQAGSTRGSTKSNILLRSSLRFATLCYALLRLNNNKVNLKEKNRAGGFLNHSYIYIYIYIYIYPPAPLGPPGCEGYCANHCFQVPPVLQSQVDSQVFQFKSASVSLQVWYLLLAVCRSAVWCLVTVYWTRG
jgi:hypothetical protein